MTEGRLTDTIAGLGKLNNTRKARYVIAEARDLLGGNGILLENHVIRHMSDIEVLHTYEGTEADANPHRRTRYHRCQCLCLTPVLTALVLTRLQPRQRGKMSRLMFVTITFATNPFLDLASYECASGRSWCVDGVGLAWTP